MTLCAPLAPAIASPPSPAIERVLAVLDELMRAVADGLPVIGAALVMAVWGRLRRIANKLAMCPGRPAVAPAMPRPSVARADRRRSAEAAVVRRFGWLMRLGLGSAVAIARSRLADLLATADIAEALARDARATRLLRPLCHMLAIPVPTPRAAPALLGRATPDRAKADRVQTGRAQTGRAKARPARPQPAVALVAAPDPDRTEAARPCSRAVRGAERTAIPRDWDGVVPKPGSRLLC